MKLIIEVKGIGIPNKGAELMLVAIIEHFKGRGIDVKLVSEPYTDYFFRAQYGLYQRASLSFKGYALDWVWALVPARLRKKYGIILDKEIDVILDASGFAYGEQWGVKKLRNRLSKRMESYKKNNASVILMPQAFGPFEDDRFKAELWKLAEYADLICVRDNESYEFLTNIVGKRENIARYPDFTGVVEPTEHSIHEKKDYGICFIPNAKMIEMRNDGDAYKREIIRSVRWAYEKDTKITLLVHEGHKDMALAEYIVNQVSDDIPIITATDPKEIKQIISRSRIVVSSRFHGLVSALSQGVPAIATGWSHKYAELMQDYKVDHLMVEALTDLNEKLIWISEDSNYESVKLILENESKVQKNEIHTMWDRIDNILGLERL